MYEIDPASGLPKILLKKKRDEKEEDQKKIQAIESEQLISELRSDEGKRLLNSLLIDFSESVDQISVDLSTDQLYAIAARISYIRNRISDWGVKIKLGELARQELEKKLGLKKL